MAVLGRVGAIPETETLIRTESGPIMHDRESLIWNFKAEYYAEDKETLPAWRCTICEKLFSLHASWHHCCWGAQYELSRDTWDNFSVGFHSDSPLRGRDDLLDSEYSLPTHLAPTPPAETAPQF